MVLTTEQLNFRRLTGVLATPGTAAFEAAVIRQRASLEAALLNPDLSLAARARAQQGLAVLNGGAVPSDIGAVNQRTGELVFASPAPSGNGGLATLKSELADMQGNPLLLGVAAGLGGLAVGAGLVGLSRSRKRKAKSSSRSKHKGSKSRSRRGSRKGKRSGPKKPRNRRGGAVKDRYKGHRVYRTKRGQPYILKANGQARFVKA